MYDLYSRINPFEGATEHYQEGATIFFLTVNSNRTRESVTWGQTENAIMDLVQELNFGDVIKNDSLATPMNHVNQLIVEGVPEEGAIMHRVHAHIVIGVNHDGSNKEYYYLDRDRIIDVFERNWGVRGLHVNIKAVTSTPKTADQMRDYLNTYRTDKMDNLY